LLQITIQIQTNENPTPITKPTTPCQGEPILLQNQKYPYLLVGTPGICQTCSKPPEEIKQRLKLTSKRPTPNPFVG